MGGSINRRTVVQVSMGMKSNPITKTTKDKKAGSSGRTPASDPEFSPQSKEEKKKKEEEKKNKVKTTNFEREIKYKKFCNQK
jgi:hypothetical protein